MVVGNWPGRGGTFGKAGNGGGTPDGGVTVVTGFTLLSNNSSRRAWLFTLDFKAVVVVIAGGIGGSGGGGGRWDVVVWFGLAVCCDGGGGSGGGCGVAVLVDTVLVGSNESSNRWNNGLIRFVLTGWSFKKNLTKFKSSQHFLDIFTPC